MTKVIIAIGTNAEREKNICGALNALNLEFGSLSISPVYKSDAQQSDPQQNNTESLYYYNLVVAFNTDVSVAEIKRKLKVVEDQYGRERNVPQVTLDLDLLLYGDWVGEFENGVVPHHDIERCAYVLRPLADLFPEGRHPVYDTVYAELWERFEEKGALCPVDFVWKDNVISVSACLNMI
jgi:2-amino-4-hydroxy-6-hydroxymethyldihydropteridine diphosphokinase